MLFREEERGEEEYPGMAGGGGGDDLLEHALEIPILFAGGHLMASMGQDGRGLVVAFQQPGVDPDPRLGLVREYSSCYGFHGGDY